MSDEDVWIEHETVEPARYPDGVSPDEQRRAFVLEAIGSAASEMDGQALCQMVIDVAEMLRTGTVPAKGRLRPVS